MPQVIYCHQYETYYYNLERPVQPSNGIRSEDVMLVQWFVREYFLGNTLASAASRAKFVRVLAQATARGNWWDDGIYGPKTREGILIWENETGVPFHDGIFRPVPIEQASCASGPPWPPLYKLNILNEVYRQKMLGICSKVHERVAVERLSMNPALFSALWNQLP